MKLKKILIIIIISILLFGCYKKESRISYSTKDILYKLSDHDKSKLKKGDLLVLNSNQNLVFYDFNKSFESGTYRLDKDDIDLFSKDVYLINISNFINNKYSNITKIKMKDSKYGDIYLNLSGTYDFKIDDSKVFLNGYIEYSGDVYDYINFLINDVCLRYFSSLNNETYTVLSINSSEVSSNISKKINSKNYGFQISNFSLKIDISDESVESIGK